MSRWFKARRSHEAYFCVVGSPIAHSKSPLIHAAFADQFDIALSYERVEVHAGDLAAAVAEFRRFGGRGLNVTVPLKEEAWALAAERSPRAAAAGAANTLWFGDAGQVCADNTDGVGLVHDLEANHGVRLAGRTVLLLGAGGAARGVLPALQESAPARILISNRTPARACAVASAFAGQVPLEVLPWGAHGDRAPDIIINATALSLAGELPPLDAASVAAHTVCYDMMYSSAPTVFVEWARRRGAALALDGLGMLVEQAAEAFFIWHGLRPQTGPVIAALRAA